MADPNAVVYASSHQTVKQYSFFLLLAAMTCSRNRQIADVPLVAVATRDLSVPAIEPIVGSSQDASVANGSSKPDAGAHSGLHHRELPDPKILMTNLFCAGARDANKLLKKINSEHEGYESSPGDKAFDEAVEKLTDDESSSPGGWFWLSDQSDALQGYGPICLPMRDGSAWAVELLQGKTHELRLTLAHYAPSGQRQALTPMPMDSNMAGNVLGPNRVVAFDYDGDGLEEFWVENTRWCHREPAQTLYTFRAGRLVPYPLPHAARIDEIDDVDNDGRPDLFTSISLEIAFVPCSFGDIMCTGYSFKRLLHSLPDGTFSEDDNVARGYADEQCKDNPVGQPIVVHKDDAPAEVDGDKTANGIACARLRGIASARIVAELRAKCPSVVQSREARKYAPTMPCYVKDCTTAEEAAQVRACPDPLLHPTCIDWMFDLAREKPSPVLR